MFMAVKHNVHESHLYGKVHEQDLTAIYTKIDFFLGGGTKSVTDYNKLLPNQVFTNMACDKTPKESCLLSLVAAPSLKSLILH